METKVSLSSRAKLLLPKNLRLALTPRQETPKKREPNCDVGSPVNSPVTDLALNLGELSTHGYGQDEETPKRRAAELRKSRHSHSSRDARSMRPTVLEKQLSIDQGCFLESPSPVDIDSPFIEARFGALLKNDKTETDRMPYLKSTAFQRFQSMPVPFCGFEQSPTTSKIEPKLCLDDHLLAESSPEKSHGWAMENSPAKGTLFCSVDDEDNSQDSGLGMDRVDNRVMASDFCFVEPVAPPPRRLRVLSDETNSPHKYSPVRKSRPLSASLTSLHFSKESFASPIKLRKSTLTASPFQDDGDDGFLELVDDEHEENNSVPRGLDQLLAAPVLSSPCRNERTPEKRCRIRQPMFFDNSENIDPSSCKAKTSCSRRGLFRSPSAPQRLHRSESFNIRPRPFSSKRAEPCTDGELTPIQSKRRRSIVEGGKKEVTPRTLQRCHSDTEAMIKMALKRNDEEQDLIGDFSKPFCLPLIPGKHQDLKSIAPETVEKLLRNEYSHVIEKFLIIDCRYPYEYQGGHIKSAKNIYTREGIMEEFIKSQAFHNQPASPGKRNVIIFHCEFSSERAPNLSRFLRNKDREANSSVYPSLNYPEIYLLDGGYKNFFNHSKVQCEPQTYKPMMHEAHSDDLKHFRQKSKSWAGEKSGRSSMRSGLKYV